MAKEVLDSVTKVGVVMENYTAGLTLGAVALDDAAVIGGLYDPVATPTLFQFELPESVTVDGFEPMWEDFNVVSDVFMKHREIRDNGGVTFTIVVGFDSAESGTSTDVGGINILNAVKNFKHGATTSSAGAASYNALEDINGGNKVNDDAGWAVEVLIAGTYKYVFHNCTNFSCTSQDIAFQKALRYTLKFEDARVVQVAAAASLTDHDDSA